MPDAKFYLARFMRPEAMASRSKREEFVYPEHGPRKPLWDYERNEFKRQTVQPSKSPFLGVCGLFLQNVDPNRVYMCGKFCMPLVGGGKNVVEPFEYESFEQAQDEIGNHHELGAAFEHPVPTHAVMWRVTLFSHYDCSRRTVLDSADWKTTRLYWLATLGLISEAKHYLDLEIRTKLGRDTSIVMPDGYSFFDCTEYNYTDPRELLDNPGDVDRFANCLP